MSCSAVNCSSRTTKGGVKDPDLSFHTFPKCPEIRSEWVKAIRRENWEPTKHSRLCSNHFEASFFIAGLSIKKLKSDAVPTIFEGYPKNCQPKSPIHERSISEQSSSTVSNLEVSTIDTNTTQSADEFFNHANSSKKINTNLLLAESPNMDQAELKSESSGRSKMTKDKECRACLSKLLADPGKALFEAWFTPWAVRGAIIADDLAKLADIEISEDDEFSKVICTVCYKRLSDACTFMITVQINDNILRSRLKGVTSGTIGNITGNQDNSPYNTNRNTEQNTDNIETITGNVETVTGNVETITGDIDISWPQPIQVAKSTSLQIDCINVEVKQEILSEDENGAQMEQDWEPMMDIKIEPEEIMAPVLQPTIAVNGVAGSEDDANSNGEAEYLDSAIKQEPLSGDEQPEEARDLPLDCMLCSKEFHSVTGLKAHVIAIHSYGSVKRKADMPPTDESETGTDTTCHTCQESFQTATDLMVHASSHSEHACYVCGATFRSFLQLSRHGPGCADKRKATGRTRPPARPQKRPLPTYNLVRDETTVRTTIIIPNQDQKNLPGRSRAETKAETSTNERKTIETVQDMDVELENCDDRLVNYDSNQETSQGILKLQFIDESTDKEEEKLDKIKIGSKKYEKTKIESKSSMKDEMKTDSGQEKPEHSNEVGEKLDLKSTDCEQFDDNVPIKDILLENGPVIEESVGEQDKSLGERISTESLEMQTEPILDPELKSLTDMLEESNSTFNETNDSISGTEDSKNYLKSDKLPELKELTIGTIDTNVNSDSVDFQSQHQVDNTISMNAENHNETKDSIEKEMDKIFKEQMLEQDNSGKQNTIQVIPEIAENVKDLNEMKVHLAINPLNKEELFDTDVKITDLECENTQNSEDLLLARPSRRKTRRRLPKKQLQSRLPSGEPNTETPRYSSSILENSHMPAPLPRNGNGVIMRRRCFRCWRQQKKRKDSGMFCTVCNTGFCIDCFGPHHVKNNRLPSGEPNTETPRYSPSILENSHMPVPLPRNGNGFIMRRRCFRCWRQQKKRKDSGMFCKVCNTGFCIDCFGPHHVKNNLLG